MSWSRLTSELKVLPTQPDTIPEEDDDEQKQVPAQEGENEEGVQVCTAQSPLTSVLHAAVSDPSRLCASRRSQPHKVGKGQAPSCYRILHCSVRRVRLN